MSLRTSHFRQLDISQKCHTYNRARVKIINDPNMVSRNIELPFLPKYQTEHLARDTIRITWFESRFSQSHYNVHNKPNGSNACTLIAILMASKCQKYNVTISDPQSNLNIELIHLLAISMLEGNKIHEELKMKKVLKHINLNVPEALKYTEESTSNLVEWKSSIYMERLSRSLYDNLRSNYMEWLKLNKEPKQDLYIILIADSKTVLFLIQSRSDTVALFDSHQHSADQGAFIAMTNRDRLGHLCFWFKDVVRKYYNSDPKLYELSFLHVKGAQN